MQVTSERRTEVITSSLVIAVIIAVVVWATAALAHSWYPAHCCSGMDCAPVTKVEIIPTQQVHAGMSLAPASPLPSRMFVTTIHGRVEVPANFKRDNSRDHMMHACMRAPAGGELRLICLFEQPGL